MTGKARDITTLLELGADDSQSEGELFALVQHRFQQIARRLLAAEKPGHSLQPTVLVDDAFMQLIRAREQSWENREQFFSHAAKIMRHALVDRARAALAVKRGAGARPVALEDTVQGGAAQPPQSLIELNDVLERLESSHPAVFQVFDLHYFMQFELQEIANDILDVSYSTVRRRWKMARAFLHRELVGDPS